MILLKTNAGANHHKINKASHCPRYLSHKDEPVDFYREYKDSDFLPTKGGRNLQNLFADFDTKDYRWLNVARSYFSKR